MSGWIDDLLRYVHAQEKPEPEPEQERPTVDIFASPLEPGLPPGLELPAVGWRLLTLIPYGAGSTLSSLTRPSLAWNTIGDRRPSWMEERDLQAICRPRRWSYMRGKTMRDTRTTRKPHITPYENCSCGYAAYHSLDYLHAEMRGSYPVYMRNSQFRDISGEGVLWGMSRGECPITILALVWGYGNLIAYDTTFRSEFMTLAALCSDGVELGPIATAHAESMNIPALSMEEMREYAKYAGRNLAP